MNRRDFLRMLGIGAAAAVAPKFIFDVGANLHRADHGWNELELLVQRKAALYKSLDECSSIFKEAYGKYAENVYAGSSLLDLALPGSLVSVGKEVVVPISFGYDPSNS